MDVSGSNSSLCDAGGPRYAWIGPKGIARCAMHQAAACAPGPCDLQAACSSSSKIDWQAAHGARPALCVQLTPETDERLLKTWLCGRFAQTAGCTVIVDCRLHDPLLLPTGRLTKFIELTEGLMGASDAWHLYSRMAGDSGMFNSLLRLLHVGRWRFSALFDMRQSFDFNLFHGRVACLAGRGYPVEVLVADSGISQALIPELRAEFAKLGVPTARWEHGGPRSIGMEKAVG